MSRSAVHHPLRNHIPNLSRNFNLQCKINPAKMKFSTKPNSRPPTTMINLSLKLTMTKNQSLRTNSLLSPEIYQRMPGIMKGPNRTTTINGKNLNNSTLKIPSHNRIGHPRQNSSTSPLICKIRVFLSFIRISTRKVEQYTPTQV